MISGRLYFGTLSGLHADAQYPLVDTIIDSIASLGFVGV